MAVTTSAVIGLAASAATTGMSFAQRGKQRKLQIKAQEDAKKFMEEARKKIDVNFYDQLSIIKEPYELERDALLASGAQAIEASKESQRGVAATAGRVAMAQNTGQGQIRTAMGQDLMNLEKMSAAEEARLRDIGVRLDLEEVAGANLAEANAWELEQQALQQGMAGVTSMAGQIAGMPSLYGTEKKWLQGVMGYQGQKQVTGKDNIGADGNDRPNAPVQIPAGMTGASAPLTPIEGVSQYDISTPPVDPNLNTPYDPAPGGVPFVYNGKNLNPQFANKNLLEVQEMLREMGVIPPDGQFTIDQLAQYIYV